VNYVSINGEKYQKVLLDMAIAYASGRGESKISKDEVLEMINSAKGGESVTERELKTLHYIRNNFDFTPAAAVLFDAEITHLSIDTLGV
jgi:hypothetical protein